MLLGLLLAERGAKVSVLEGHETFDREFRGEVLQPSTALLCRRWIPASASAVERNDDAGPTLL